MIQVKTPEAMSAVKEGVLLRDLIARIRDVYPDWSGFNNPEFVEEEVSYKRKAAEFAQSLLSKEALRVLLDDGQVNEVFDRLKKVGSATNLLYLGTPSSGDLAPLYSDSVDPSSIAEAVFDLLYGDGDACDRIDRMAHFLKANRILIRWPFLTYFLFLCHPDTEVFIKPTLVTQVFDLIGQPVLLSGDYGKRYGQVRSVMRQLGRTLAPFAPADMIDIQSLMYVLKRSALQAEVPGSTLSEPLNRIFRSVEEANAVLDFLRDSIARMGIDYLRDERYALTLSTRGSKAFLSLNIGNWGTMWFKAPRTVVHISLLADEAEALGIPLYKEGSTGFATEPGEPVVKVFCLPLATLLNPPVSLQSLINKSHVHFGERFRDWDGSPYRKYHTQEIADALFDTRARATLLQQGVVERRETTSPAFVAEAFDLLEQLRDDPTRDFYESNRDDFDTYVESPFKALMKAVATRLPKAILSFLETEKGVFGRIPKNDYGRGGAWDFFWGAFYPKGGKRIADAQLFAGMHPDKFEFGFYVGEYGREKLNRLLRSLQQHQRTLLPILNDRIAGGTFVFGSSAEQTKNEHQEYWRKWFEQGDQADVRIARSYDRESILQLSADDLASEMSDAFERLYPLMLLATVEDPTSVLAAYLDLDAEEEEVNEAYSLSQCASDTGYSEDDLQRWLDALERKGQAVLYGPPGTGKTYLADHIARHLVSESDGIVELVQFHPAYSYEDFVQGIRPQSTEGVLTYPIVPGRFKLFCDAARHRKGTCVLIIDEINRANLARVFGELMYLLEYRNRDVELAGGTHFSIPKNVRIIGTMNTADRSIALVDHALRRRFAFIYLKPRYDILEAFHARNGNAVNGLTKVLQKLNADISDPNYEVGISFFLHEQLHAHIADIWQLEIEPYLEEYFYDQPSKLNEYRWEVVKVNLLPSGR